MSLNWFHGGSQSQPLKGESMRTYLQPSDFRFQLKPLPYIGTSAPAETTSNMAAITTTFVSIF